MKFNDREIALKGASVPGDLEGVLHYMRPQNNDWANWYSQPSYKERKVKLVANMLFYYRLGEPEPLGVLVLENCTVQHERPFHGIAFPFSLEYADEMQRKHIFGCRCQEEADRWVAALKTASYEHWRTELSILQKKIIMRTGSDPMVSYAKNQFQVEQLNWSKRKTVGPQKSSFLCHLDTTNAQTFMNSTYVNNVDNNTHQNTNEPDLIQF